MSYIDGVNMPVPLKTGIISYKASVIPPNSNRLFFIALGNSGIDPEEPDVTGMHFFAISGESGKLYDSEQNYIHSYASDESLYLKGVVFKDYYNCFVNNTLINVSGARRTGDIDSFYFKGLNFNNFSLSLNEPYQIPDSFLS